jgi:hypothetical protein
MITDTTAKSTELTADEQRHLTTYRYLSQGDVWLPSGKPLIPIADMDLEWRYNASRWMERRSIYYAMSYSYGEILWLTQPRYHEILDGEKGDGETLGRSWSELDLMTEMALADLDREADWRATNPDAWIRQTPLHRALTTGLPTSGRELHKLEHRAKHYAGCPKREQTDGSCDCSRLAAVVAHEQEIANGTPEWTDD